MYNTFTKPLACSCIAGLHCTCRLRCATAALLASLARAVGWDHTSAQECCGSQHARNTCTIKRARVGALVLRLPFNTLIYRHSTLRHGIVAFISSLTSRAATGHATRSHEHHPYSDDAPGLDCIRRNWPGLSRDRHNLSAQYPGLDRILRAWRHLLSALGLHSLLMGCARPGLGHGELEHLRHVYLSRRLERDHIPETRRWARNAIIRQRG